MASSSSRQKSREELMTCSVCFNRLRDPRVFPVCQHAFCYECIVNWIESNQGNTHIPCPQCRAEVEVGNPPDLSQFKRNHLFNNIMLELHEASSMMDEEVPTTSTTCGIHKGEQLNHYCGDCEIPICTYCAESQDHHEHKRFSIDVLANETKEGLVSKLIILREYKAELSEDISNFEIMKRDITEEKERVHGEIIQRFDSLTEIMQLQKQRLLERADQLTNHKLGIIKKKLVSHRQTQDSVKKNIDDMEKIYKSMECAEKVLYTGKCVSLNVENVPFRNEQLPVDSDMKFLVSSSTEDFKASLAKSHLVANDNICPEYCTSALQPRYLKIGEKAKITVRCKDSQNYDIKHGGQIIKAEFTGYAAAAVADVNEIDRNDGTHVIEFMPTGRGELIVKFCINGQEAPKCMLKTTVK